ncbi:MAG: FxsA family protein [Gammaproteobacteria bacterium]
MNIFRTLLILFLAVPILEIYLLIEVGSVIGAMPTVFLVVFTAVLGAYLLRYQGFATMQRVRTTLAQGEIPAIEMLEGVVLLIGGALLLTPGFFTDAIGFMCLVPALRRFVILWLIEHKLIMSASVQHSHGFRSEPGQAAPSHKPRVIDGESWHVNENDK